MEHTFQFWGQKVRGQDHMEIFCIYFLVMQWLKRFILETSYAIGGQRKEDTYRFLGQKVMVMVTFSVYISF